MFAFCSQGTSSQELMEGVQKTTEPKWAPAVRVLVNELEEMLGDVKEGRRAYWRKRIDAFKDEAEMEFRKTEQRKTKGKKNDNLLALLKKSLQQKELTEFQKDDSLASNLTNLRNLLIKLELAQKASLKHGYEIGKQLEILKEYCQMRNYSFKDFLTKRTDKSYRYLSYFLRLSKFLDNYPRIRHSNLSFDFISKKITVLERELASLNEDEIKFWKTVD